MVPELLSDLLILTYIIENSKIDKQKYIIKVLCTHCCPEMDYPHIRDRASSKERILTEGSNTPGYPPLASPWVGILFMLFFFNRYNKIKSQIEVFLKWREKMGMNSPSYREWILLFAKNTKTTDVLDITRDDILNFLAYVRTIRNGQWPVYQAEKSVRQFIRFYSARGKMINTLADYTRLCEHNNVDLISHIKRNKEIVQKRLKNPKIWSWRRLGDHFGMHYSTARQIFYRDRIKYGGRGVIHR